MYPDFLSLDSGYVGEMYKKTGKTISPMGCRAYLSDYKDENGESYFVGRANIGAVSLNLPMIWKLSDGVTFYEDLEKYLQLSRAFLKKRYDALANNVCSTNPLAFTQGGIRGGNKKPDDKIGYDIVKSFTASFGVTSLNELNVLMEGHELHESDRKRANEVVDFISKRVDEFKKEDGYLYALYATPAESLAGTQLQQFRKEYGVIKGVSDKEYFSNGFHCPVTAAINPFQKQDNEYELFHKINGGHIQYVRIEDPSNILAIKTLVQRGMSMGFYQGINFTLSTCEECGFKPSRLDENHLECPNCGSTDITTISRVCGYLGIQYSNGNTRFNDSKLAEVKDRVSM
jgi:ribonucleoside-triphosphate reductase